MKQSVLITLISLLSLSGWAHLEVKSYAGKDLQGAACTVDVKGIAFQNNMAHPLNERVEVHFTGQTYFLSHPSNIDMSTGAVSFNHDYLQTVVAQKTGAEAVVLHMNHEEGAEGPTKLVRSVHDWKSGTVEKSVCNLR